MIYESYAVKSALITPPENHINAVPGEVLGKNWQRRILQAITHHANAVFNPEITGLASRLVFKKKPLKVFLSRFEVEVAGPNRHTNFIAILVKYPV